MTNAIPATTMLLRPSPMGVAAMYCAVVGTPTTSPSSTKTKRSIVTASACHRRRPAIALAKARCAIPTRPKHLSLMRRLPSRSCLVTCKHELDVIAGLHITTVAGTAGEPCRAISKLNDRFSEAA